MSAPKYCYRCDEIITFCQCDESIYSRAELIDRQRQEIERLRADYERCQEYRIEANNVAGRYRAALERNTQEIHRYKHIDRGHHCGWRVIAEAMIARSREALQEGES